MSESKSDTAQNWEAKIDEAVAEAEAEAVAVTEAEAKTKVVPLSTAVREGIPIVKHALAFETMRESSDEEDSDDSDAVCSDEECKDCLPTRLATKLKATHIEEKGEEKEEGEDMEDMEDEEKSVPQKLEDYYTRVICERPMIIHIENLVSEDEANAIIAYGIPLLTPSTVVENDQLVVRPYRNSYTACLSPLHPALKGLLERVSGLSGYPVSHIEQPKLVRYRSGERYDGHVDFFGENSKTAGKMGERIFTFFVYLNCVEAENGGETEFTKLGIKVHPCLGDALFWVNMDPATREYFPETNHAGKPIIGDITKYGLNIWIREHSS